MWRRLFLLLLCSLPLLARAQAPEQALPISYEETLPLYYVVDEETMAFARPDSSDLYLQLRVREPVYLLGRQGRWAEVRTRDGAEAYVSAGALSNVWLRVSKRERTLYAYRGTELIASYPVDLGYNGFSDKERRGGIRSRDHWRTPEGSFFIARKNPRSAFYKALVLNYPAAEDARRGLKQGLISEEEFDAIVAAEAESRMPPMNTALGGWIEIHGRGTGARSDWTQGCIAVHDEHIDALWRWVRVGTPVLVEP